MRYEIILAPEAVVDLNQFAAKPRAEVKAGIELHLRHEATKVSKSRIKRLKGMSRPQYRLRIGEVRVFYDVINDTVEVLGIVEKSKALQWLERYGEK